MPRMFLQQRLYPTLRLGLTPAAARDKQRHISFHCRQGDWDGACGLHCAAMALALLGRIASVKALSIRRKGVVARLWQAAHAMYFDGMNAEDMETVLMSLDINLYVKRFEGRHRQTIAFTQAQLAAGRLAIVGYRNREGTVDHWVLAVGVEGMQTGRRFTPQTLLVMDPGLAEPIMCGYNGRFQFALHPLPQKSIYITYLGNDGSNYPVTLIDAVAIGSTE